MLCGMCKSPPARLRSRLRPARAATVIGLRSRRAATDGKEAVSNGETALLRKDPFRSSGLDKPVAFLV